MECDWNLERDFENILFLYLFRKIEERITFSQKLSLIRKCVKLLRSYFHAFKVKSHDLVWDVDIIENRKMKCVCTHIYKHTSICESTQTFSALLNKWFTPWRVDSIFGNHWQWNCFATLFHHTHTNLFICLPKIKGILCAWIGTANAFVWSTDDKCELNERHSRRNYDESSWWQRKKSV